MKRTILVATLVLGSSVCSQGFGFDLLDRMLGLKGCGCDSTCCDTGVCDTGAYGCAVEPACGCEAPCGGACGGYAEPACGCEAPCGGACGGCAEPACGVAAPCGVGCEPTCDAASACCGSNGHRGLLHKLFGHHHRSSCDAGCGCATEPACGCEAPCGALGCADPACGCEVAGGCDSGCCGSKRPHLLARLFGGHHGRDSGCDAGCCDTMPGYSSGYSNGMSAPVAAPPVQIQDAAPMPPAPVVDPSAYLNSKRRVIQASARYVR